MEDLFAAHNTSERNGHLMTEGLVKSWDRIVVPLI